MFQGNIPWNQRGTSRLTFWLPGLFPGECKQTSVTTGNSQWPDPDPHRISTPWTLLAWLHLLHNQTSKGQANLLHVGPNCSGKRLYHDLKWSLFLCLLTCTNSIFAFWIETSPIPRKPKTPRIKSPKSATPNQTPQVTKPLSCSQACCHQPCWLVDLFHLRCRVHQPVLFSWSTKTPPCIFFSLGQRRSVAVMQA